MCHENINFCAFVIFKIIETTVNVKMQNKILIHGWLLYSLVYSDIKHVFQARCFLGKKKQQPIFLLFHAAFLKYFLLMKGQLQSKEESKKHFNHKWQHKET